MTYPLGGHMWVRHGTVLDVEDAVLRDGGLVVGRVVSAVGAGNALEVELEVEDDITEFRLQCTSIGPMAPADGALHINVPGTNCE